MDDHTNLVALVKATLVSRGVSLAGACGAFEITKRVAWALRAEGAGLLDKPDGENCQAYAVGIVAYPAGVIVDMLGDAGGANGPQWNVEPSVSPDRWRPPFDPGDVTPPPQPEPEPPPTPEAAPEWFVPFLDDMRELVEAVGAITGAQTLFALKLNELDTKNLNAIHADLDTIGKQLTTIAANGLRLRF